MLVSCKNRDVSTSSTDANVPLAMYAPAFPVRSGSSVVPSELPPLTIMAVPLNAMSHSVSFVVICPVAKLNLVNSPEMGCP